jgi:oxygen-independent coproporphyrinogen-3 oxidase
MSSLYIHIPFCLAKCRYCDFYSIPYRFDVAAHYIKTISGQIKTLNEKFSTVYIGGGTPTILDTNCLKTLLGAIKNLLADGYEFTIEGNPDTIDSDKMRMFLEHGVNRISIGVQSFRDKFLKILGRGLSSGVCFSTIEKAYKAGFKNISLDLIFGIPSQSLNDVEIELQKLFALPIQHISWYGLSFEKGTQMYLGFKSGLIYPPDEDIVSKMYIYIIDRLKSMGFQQYEISNFAKHQFMCRHNQKYWMNEEYIGIGAGAVSYIDGVRMQNIQDVERYVECVESGKTTVISTETLSPIHRAKETSALKIRTIEGIEVDWFKEKTGFNFQELHEGVLEHLIEQGLLSFNRGRYYLTERGLLFCDTVCSEFMSS